MIELTKLNGDRFYLNENWIEIVEALPDTTITLRSGNKVVVLEKMDDVFEKMLDWQVIREKIGRRNPLNPASHRK